MLRAKSTKAAQELGFSLMLFASFARHSHLGEFDFLFPRTIFQPSSREVS